MNTHLTHLAGSTDASVRGFVAGVSIGIISG